MGTLEIGAKQAVENCLKIKPSEKVVIITDRKTLKISSIIRKAVEKITRDIQFFIMEEFGERPIDRFPISVKQALEVADVSFYVAQDVKGELQTFRNPMLETTYNNEKLRHAHMPGMTPEIMKKGMCSDYKEIQRISKIIYEKVKNTGQIKVTTKKGTNIIVEFNPRLRWKISDGDIKPYDWNNLPDGEVFTSPDNVSGKVIIDGCLGDFFIKYGSLENNPVVVEIKDSRVQKIQSSNKKLEKELRSYLFETDENSNRIGEFAIGTNIGLKKLIGNLLQDEKFPGVHIAFGDPYPKKTGAKWQSKIHVDGVIKNPTIFVDGEIIMDRGKFLSQP